MKLSPFSSSAIAAVVVLMAGCTSTGYKKAGDTSTAIEKTASNIHKGNGQIDAVLFSLSSLVNSPEADLKSQFSKFDSAVTKLDSLATDVNTQAAAMQSQGADYFRTWDGDMAKIQNEDIRARSNERKIAVAARFDAVRLSYVQTKAAFVPFMSDIKDIRTALATDLTAGGIDSIKSSANKAKSNVTPLRESLSSLEADFRALGVSMSTNTSQPGN